MDILELKGTKRVQAIQNLPVIAENADLLLQLATTSKGIAKEIALISLAQLNYPKALPLWQKQFKTKNKGEPIFIKTCADDISDLVAPYIEDFLVNLLKNEKGHQLDSDEYNQFFRCMILMLGKSSDKMLNIYRLIAENLKKLSSFKLTGEFNYGGIDYFTFAQSTAISRAKFFPILLAKSIIASQSPKLIALANELYQTYDKNWLTPVFIADLIAMPAKQVFEKYAPLLDDDKLADFIYDGLAMLSFDVKIGRHKAVCDWARQIYGEVDAGRYETLPIYENLDERWFQKLITPISRSDRKIIMQAYTIMGVLYQHYDQMLGELLPTHFDNPAIKDALIAYFKHKQAIHNGTSTLYLDIFQRLNIEIPEDMFLQYILCKANATSKYSLKLNIEKYTNWDKSQIQNFLQKVPNHMKE